MPAQLVLYIATNQPDIQMHPATQHHFTKHLLPANLAAAKRAFLVGLDWEEVELQFLHKLHHVYKKETR